jgi:putative glycosyltransferase (TIGR04372 family)
VVILVILWWLKVKKRFVVIGIPLYSFAPLVFHTPYEIEYLIQENERQGRTYKVLAFINLPFIAQNEWKLQRLSLHYGRNLQLVNWSPLRLLYRFYRPGHSEDPIHQTLMSLQKRKGTLVNLQGIAERSWSGERTFDGCSHTERKFEISKRIFTLDRQEEIFCKSLACKHGWNFSVYPRLVTLVARDSLFRREQHPAYRHFGKHARDMELSVFIPAITYLVTNGYFVVRLGSKQEPIPFSHPGFWDYGSLSEHDERLDFYLGLNSFACISTGAGAEISHSIHGKALSYVGFYGDYLTLDPGQEGCLPRLIVPKKVRESSSMRLLSYTETYVDPSVHQSLERREAQYFVEDLTPEEVLSATTIFMSMISDNSAFELERESQREAFKSWRSAQNRYPQSLFFTEANPLIPPQYFEANRSWLLA